MKSSALNKYKPSFLDFFAGSGLVTEALKNYFDIAWANDIDNKKNLYIAQTIPQAFFTINPYRK